MANGLLDPVYRILPSKIDYKRRSWDPLGQLGASIFERGHLTLTGKALTLRRSLVAARGHVAVTGRTAVIIKQRTIQRGHLTTTGKALITRPVRWNAIPRFDINWGAVVFPYFINGMRANYLYDPTGKVGSMGVTLGGIDLAQITYEQAQDRIRIASNPSIDTVDSVYMIADGLASNTFEIALVSPISYPIYPAENRTDWTNPSAFDDVPTLVVGPGDYYGQIGPVTPPEAGTLQLGPNGYMKFTFTETVGGSPISPTLISTIRTSGNKASLSVPVSTLGQLASGQYMTMIVSTVLALTTAPDTQGWQYRGSIVPGGTDVKLYVYTKVASTPEPNINLVHSGGRIMAMTSSWRDVNATDPISVLPVFAVANDTNPVMSTPSIVVPDAHCSIISALAQGSNPVYTSAPPFYTLVDQGIVASVFWQGVSYGYYDVPVTSGLLTWNISNSGGTRAGTSFALKGRQAIITKQAATVAMRHHSATLPGQDGFGNTLWTMPVNP